MDECKQAFSSRLHLRTPSIFAEALEMGARRQFVSKSDYVRAAILDRLRADGIDPSAPNIQEPVAA